jgi:hypothetical protein
MMVELFDCWQEQVIFIFSKALQLALGTTHSPVEGLPAVKH